MAGYIFIVSAPSAAGKTSLVRAFLEHESTQRVSQVVTYTTRPPRPGERDGVDYHFVDTETFWQLYYAGTFIEYSGAYGALYASAWDSIANIPDNNARIMVIDRAGASRVLKACHNVVGIWIMPPREQVLRERLVHRGACEGDIAHRIAQSQRDMRQEQCEQMYHHWVCNDDFDDAHNALRSCIAQYIPIS